MPIAVAKEEISNKLGMFYLSNIYCKWEAKPNWEQALWLQSPGYFYFVLV